MDGMDEELEQQQDEEEEEEALPSGGAKDMYGRQRYLDMCLELGISPISQILKYLEGDEMHVAHYGMGTKGAQALTEAILVNQTLTVLRLTDNSIPDAGVRLIALALNEHRNITECDLSGNRMAAEGCAAMAAALTGRGSRIRTLGLARMKLGEKEGVVLSLALENNTILKALDLSTNDFGDRAAQALGGMLQVNIGLHDLVLSWNKLRHKGAAAIAEGLRPNLSLQSLALAWCGLKDAGAVALGPALKVNQSLMDLDLSGNGFTVVGARAIAEGVVGSVSLASVALDNNDLQEAGGQAILAAVQKNKGLVVCRIDSTNTSELVRSAVEDLLAPRLAFQRQQRLAAQNATRAAKPHGGA